MKRLPKSTRKYIRDEKARIRRVTLDLKEQNKLIDELRQRFMTPAGEMKKQMTAVKQEKKVKKKTKLIEKKAIKKTSASSVSRRIPADKKK